MKGEELAKKREEAERKARRGEIDPTHEFTFQLIGQFSGLLRHEIMDYMFNDPAMLDDLDYLYKSDNARQDYQEHDFLSQVSPNSVLKLWSVFTH